MAMQGRLARCVLPAEERNHCEYQRSLQVAEEDAIRAARQNGRAWHKDREAVLKTQADQFARFSGRFDPERVKAEREATIERMVETAKRRVEENAARAAALAKPRERP